MSYAGGKKVRALRFEQRQESTSAVAISCKHGSDWQRIPVESQGTEARGIAWPQRQRLAARVSARLMPPLAEICSGAGGAAGAEGGAAGCGAGGEGGALRGRPLRGAALLLLPHAGAAPCTCTCRPWLAASHGRGSLLRSALAGPDKRPQQAAATSSCAYFEHKYSCRHGSRGFVCFRRCAQLRDGLARMAGLGCVRCWSCNDKTLRIWELCSVYTEWVVHLNQIGQRLDLLRDAPVFGMHLEEISSTRFEIANPHRVSAILYQSDSLNRCVEVSTSGSCNIRAVERESKFTHI